MPAVKVTPITSLAQVDAALKRERDPETGKLVPKKTRARSKTIAASKFDRTLAETREMIDSGEWDGFAARHVVALYDLMHEKCYGLPPETTSTERYEMTKWAGGFVKRAFAGDYAAAVEYLRWIWDREIGIEEWAKKKGITRHRRITFNLLTSNAMLDDYRVNLARNARRA